MTAEATPRTRRTILAGALGGLTALVAKAVGSPASVGAANGDPLILGSSTNEASFSTWLKNSANPASYVVLATESSWGVLGSSNVAGFPGVGGQTTGAGGIGVQGVLNSSTFTGAIGVQGKTAGHHSQVAVDAVANTGLGEGYAVRARTLNGIALYGEATGGYGLQVVGRAVFSRSGKTTVAAGQSTKIVSGYTLDAASIVVATVQGGGGVYVKTVSVNATADTFTIRLSKAAPAAGTVVGFFIVN